MFGMDPSSKGFRFTVLFFNCLLTFGSYMVFDVPSVLETDISEMLGISHTTFQLFYSLYGWTNCGMSLIAGWIVDTLGYRRSSFIFLTLVLVGQTLFALGGSLTSVGPKGQLYMMLAGRLIFGTGGGSITIVQNAITSHYFKGKELALAFGCTLTMSRLGSVINFFSTRSLCDATSLVFTLWFGTGCCLIGVVAAFAISLLDRHATAAAAATAAASGERMGEKKSGKAVNLRDVASFEARYWLVSFLIMCFYVCIFAFIAGAPDFFRHQLGLSKESKTPSYLSSVVYFSSMVLSVPIGHIVDRVGRQAVLVMAAGAVVPFVFAAFIYTNIYPLWPMLALGICYTIMAAALWPSITLVVELDKVGTAMGVATSIQMIGVALSTLLAGHLQDTKWGYDGSNFFFGIMGAATVALAAVLFVLDRSRDGLLSVSKAEQSRRKEELRASLLPEVGPQRSVVRNDP